MVEIWKEDEMNRRWTQMDVNEEEIRVACVA
jgi:hypothetical protein